MRGDVHKVLDAQSSEIVVHFCEFCDPLDVVDSIDEATDLPTRKESTHDYIFFCSPPLAYLVQRNIPTRMFHLIQCRNRYRYIPRINTLRIGVEGREE